MTLVSRIHHVGLAVEDLDAAERFLSEAFGLSVARRSEVPEKDFAALYLDWGGAQVEVIEIGGYVPAATESLNHFAIAVEDVTAAEARLRELGADSEAGVFEFAGRLTAFFRVGALGGCRLQLVEAAD